LTIFKLNLQIEDNIIGSLHGRRPAPISCELEEDEENGRRQQKGRWVTINAAGIPSSSSPAAEASTIVGGNQPP
jgi:hypothetical protein